ncbi:hypothetical protein [Burkholderia sp. BE17]|uniref:hypothetical protein n=1 Tax=Burkholderia sp. BE17 TaxID=2656644 RepID=UPI00187B41AB|nr:hypothetical protein [Burkholderia sp. BE17]
MFASYPGEARILGLSAPLRREVQQVFRRHAAATIPAGKPDRALHRIALRHLPVDTG